MSLEKKEESFVDAYNSLKFQNEEQISSFLKCPICFQIFNNPKRLLFCGHTFCELCLSEMNMGKCCFLCSQPYKQSDIQDDLIAKKIINDLRVSCQRTSDCQWVGSLNEHRMHIQNNECLSDNHNNNNNSDNLKSNHNEEEK